MPYASSSSVLKRIVAGRIQRVVTVTETGVTSASDAWTFNLATYNIPSLGWVTKHQCVLTNGAGGTATTVDPRLGSVAGGTDLLDNGTPASATYQDCNKRYLLVGQILYGSSRVDATIGAGSIVTTFVLLEGHQT